MTLDRALTKLLKALGLFLVAAFFIWASVDVVAPVGPVATGLLADAESAVRNVFTHS